MNKAKKYREITYGTEMRRCRHRFGMNRTVQTYKGVLGIKIINIVLIIISIFLRPFQRLGRKLSQLRLVYNQSKVDLVNKNTFISIIKHYEKTEGIIRCAICGNTIKNRGVSAIFFRDKKPFFICNDSNCQSTGYEE